MKTRYRTRQSAMNFFLRLRRFASLLCCLALAAAKVPAVTLEHGPSPEIAPEVEVERVEIARLRVQNDVNGLIEGSFDGGQSWRTIGHVVKPTKQVNANAYVASSFIPNGTVAATAVNAIHIKPRMNRDGKRGIIWSLSPKASDQAGAASLQSEVAPGASAYTDIPGGTGIFGGPFTPFVTNPVALDNDRDNQLETLPENYIPKIGDTWVIRIERPRRYPRAITFENRFGGLITIEYYGEEPRAIGQVLRPVLGVGRFVGTYFAGVGRIRANHGGVIDISTSPVGLVGGFQIVPADHAMDPGTPYIQSGTQWMVVGPVSALDPSWEGVAPLYSAFLRPRNDPADFASPDTATTGLLGRFDIQVTRRRNNGDITDWQPVPEKWMREGTELPEAAKTALADVTQLRILFPPGESIFNNPIPQDEEQDEEKDETTDEQTAEPADE